MPWASKAQQRWGNSSSGRRALGRRKVAEFNRATNFKNLKARSKRH